MQKTEMRSLMLVRVMAPVRANQGPIRRIALKPLTHQNRSLTLLAGESG